MYSPNNRDAEREAEYCRLVALLTESAVTGDDATRAMAQRVASAAMHEGHLWRAMRLHSRDELREIFRTMFTPLFEANDKDMRWKKFLYKRLCGWPGFSG